jgi:hypothetical protein
MLQVVASGLRLVLPPTLCAEVYLAQAEEPEDLRLSETVQLRLPPVPLALGATAEAELTSVPFTITVPSR